jgi:hypothetical protein
MCVGGTGSSSNHNSIPTHSRKDIRQAASMQNISIKCGSCKIITIENLQSGKIINKVNSVKLCDLHKNTMEKGS